MRYLAHCYLPTGYYSLRLAGAPASPSRHLAMQASAAYVPLLTEYNLPSS